MVTLKKTILLLTIVFLSAGCVVKNQETSFKNQTPTPTASPAAVQSAAVLKEPISNALSRITKKPFGIYVTPENSPVNPEKFTGYHTGVDFETLPEEADADVNISAICSGKVLQKRFATGYGGILAEACSLQGQDVTVVYGHLKLTSMSVKVGESLEAGKAFAVLGKGYSSETDGERKHLHLGIYKGITINIKGYVQTKAELDAWMDTQELLNIN